MPLDILGLNTFGIIWHFHLFSLSNVSDCLVLPHAACRRRGASSPHCWCHCAPSAGPALPPTGLTEPSGSYPAAAWPVVTVVTVV